jgi:hypothetical protein
MLFYGSAAVLRGTTPGALPRRIGEALLLGLGLGVPLTGALVRGAVGRATPFARTPKEGFTTRVRYRARAWATSDWVRAVLAIALTGAVWNLATTGLAASVPFTALFALGYVAASAESLRTIPRQPGPVASQ